jgi:prevent-host-death family protein
MKPACEVSVRELKNQTTGILRRVERGERIIVTRRGRAIVRLEPATERDRAATDSLYARLQREIVARRPELRRRSDARRRADFERVSRKIARALPGRTWVEMDRLAKGDPSGRSR